MAITDECVSHPSNTSVSYFHHNLPCFAKPEGAQTTPVTDIGKKTHFMAHFRAHGS
jgi:hypothetical protein